MTQAKNLYKGLALSTSVLMALMGFSYATTASADGHRGGDSVHITNLNGAAVFNETNAGANTGGNVAGGSNAGNGGDGGDIENEGDGNQRVRGSGTGNGGRGGDSSDGGYVQTGDADAEANTVNVVNSNVTDVDSCGCEGEEDGKTRVRVFNGNLALVGNSTNAGANSGLNGAAGSNSGNGGDGGEIENEGEGNEEEGGNQRVRNTTTGNGGAGGNSGIGGTVLTGGASARSNTVNVVNSNLTRVRN